MYNGVCRDIIFMKVCTSELNRNNYRESKLDKAKGKWKYNSIIIFLISSEIYQRHLANLLIWNKAIVHYQMPQTRKFQNQQSR